MLGCAGNGLPEGTMALTFGGIATDDGGADGEGESTSGPVDPGATSTSPGMSSDPDEGSSGSPTDDAPSDATFDPTTGPGDDATTGPGDDATTGPGDDATTGPFDDMGSTSDGGCVPGVETCNGIDDDCDAEIDESDPMLGAGCGTGMPGICAEGTYACEGGNGLECEPNQSPQNETCNGVDDDCDGTPDDEGCGFPCSESDLGSASPQSVGGSTAGEDEDVAQSCGGAGVEHLMTFTAPSAGTYTFNADGSSYDTVISVHADCSGTEIA